jgi:hypothetical protein
MPTPEQLAPQLQQIESLLQLLKPMKGNPNASLPPGAQTQWSGTRQGLEQVLSLYDASFHYGLMATFDLVESTLATIGQVDQGGRIAATLCCEVLERLKKRLSSLPAAPAPQVAAPLPARVDVDAVSKLLRLGADHGEAREKTSNRMSLVALWCGILLAVAGATVPVAWRLNGTGWPLTVALLGRLIAVVVLEAAGVALFYIFKNLTREAARAREHQSRLALLAATPLLGEDRETTKAIIAMCKQAPPTRPADARGSGGIYLSQDVVDLAKQVGAFIGAMRGK